MNLRPELDAALAELGMTVHPVAELFPLISPDEMHDLTDDIKREGLHFDLVRHGSVLIDGRNRLIACKRAGVELRWEDYAGETPSRWILSANACRRHITYDAAIAICNKAMPWIEAEDEAKRKQEESRFKKGNPGDRSKWPRAVDPDSGPPRKRDIKRKHANSTAGKLAEVAGVSRHKAEQFIKVKKAVEKGELPSDTVDRIAAGKAKTSEEVKRIKPKAKRATDNVETYVKKFVRFWSQCPEEARAKIREMIL